MAVLLFFIYQKVGGTHGVFFQHTCPMRVHIWWWSQATRGLKVLE